MTGARGHVDDPTGDAALARLLAGRDRIERRRLTDDPLTLRRNDAKAVLAPEELAALLDAVPDTWQVVSAGTLITAPYDTVYFDTPDLDLFRAHRQGRLRRAKVRTRRYADRTTMLEVKLKGPARMTEKVRRPHANHGMLDADDLAWVDQVLTERIGRTLPGSVAPTVWTRYRRTVLRAPDGTERLTIDADLSTGPWRTASIDTVPADAAPSPRALIVELKSLAPRSQLLPALRHVGGRPVRLSKYAVGITAEHDVHATRWLPALRRLEHPDVESRAGSLTP